MKFQPIARASLLSLLTMLAACGGSSAPEAPTQLPVSPHIEQPARFDYFKHYNHCAVPRTGVDAQGHPYPDILGSLDDELAYLNGWLNLSYLWYKELPQPDPDNFHSAIDYFNVLKTPLLTASGKPKDRYHFTYDTARWDAMQSTGAETGYGITWARVSGTTAPRTWLVAAAEPGSPADLAGIHRGDRIVRLDGVDFINASDAAQVDKINAGLSPHAPGEVHQFAFTRDGTTADIALTAAKVVSAPVKDVQLIDTAAGKVGYFRFDSHNNLAERQLFNAFTAFRDAGVSDLVVDVRYNGGGLLNIASEFAYMVAGPQATGGKVFERPVANDKTPQQPSLTFLGKATGYPATDRVPAGTPLPSLGLKHITLLTSSGTCSASESIINSLRGIDVDVTLVGGQTCGKPYAFTPVPNCGTTYFAIEFQGVNEKGEGDYADGFAPSCQVADDFTHALGDHGEAMLSTALAQLGGQRCTATASRARAVKTELVRDPVHEIGIFEGPGRR